MSVYISYLSLDFTWPYASWLTGDCFNRLIHEQFEDRDILDAWLPYFTITTDITCKKFLRELKNCKQTADFLFYFFRQRYANP